MDVDEVTHCSGVPLYYHNNAHSKLVPVSRNRTGGLLIASQLFYLLS